MKKKIIALGASLAVMLPTMASAAAYASTTAATDFANALSDIGVLIAAGVAGALGGWVALTGLGFALRHFRKYVSGRKF